MLTSNATLYTIGEVVNRSCKVASIFLLVNILTKSEFGSYSYLLSMVGVVIIFLDAGINILLQLRASGDRLLRLFKVFFITKILLILTITLGFFLLGAMSLPLVTYPLVEWLPSVLLLSIGWDLSTFLASAHRANFDFLGEAIAKFLWSMVFIIGLATAKILDLQISAFEAVLLQLLGFIVAIIWSLARIGWRGVTILKVRAHIWSQSGKVLSISLPFAFSGALASLLNSIDQLVLGYFSQLDFLASFAIAQKFVLLMYLPLGIVQGFIMPYLAESTRKTRHVSSLNALEKMLFISLVSAVGLSQLYILAIDWVIIPILGTDKYSDVAEMGRVMVLCLPFMFMHVVLWTVLVSMRFTVLAHIPATIITLVVTSFDYVLISMGQVQLMVWSPVLANFLMLGGLSWIYRLKLRLQPISITLGVLSALLICLVAIMSYFSLSDSLGFAAVRLAVALAAATITITLAKIMFEKSRIKASSNE
jgi:O-antigen/teichoic acid export membrane protein